MHPGARALALVALLALAACSTASPASPATTPPSSVTRAPATTAAATTPTMPPLSIPTAAVSVEPTPTPAPSPTATVAPTPAIEPTPTTPPSATATATVAQAFPTATIAAATGPAIPLGNLPVYPGAQLDRNSTADTYGWTIRDPPGAVTGWMFGQWQRGGLSYACSKSFPGSTDGLLYFWRDGYGNGYSFTIIADVRTSNRGGTLMFTAIDATGGYRLCP